MRFRNQAYLNKVTTGSTLQAYEQYSLLRGKDFQLCIDFHLYSLPFHSTNSRQKTETLITVLLITRQVFLLSAMKFEKNFKQWQKQYEIGFLKNFSLVDLSMSLLPHKQFIF